MMKMREGIDIKKRKQGISIGREEGDIDKDRYERSTIPIVYNA